MSESTVSPRAGKVIGGESSPTSVVEVRDMIAYQLEEGARMIEKLSIMLRPISRSPVEEIKEFPVSPCSSDIPVVATLLPLVTNTESLVQLLGSMIELIAIHADIDLASDECKPNGYPLQC